jgi:peptidoglycan/xylan/chitin deacetylase (PgdA/CDA1 family)
MLTRRSVSAAAGASLLAVAGASAAPHASSWPGGAKAAVSLTYDDALGSQLDNALPALERAGFKATFFLTWENIGARADDWVKVARQGHEMGNHTMTHPCGLQGYSATSFARDELIPMEAWLDARFGQATHRLYAYPCSVTDLGPGDADAQRARYEAILKSIGFRAARACDQDSPNSSAHARDHPYRLRASATTYDRDDPTLACDYVRGAMRSGLWAILVFHNIVATRLGPGDTSIASHDAALAWLRTQPVWCAPMGRVLDHLRIG